MKIGDKILCIENCNRHRISFIKGKTYIINSIQNGEIYISDREYSTLEAFFKIISHPNYWNFDDFFINIKEQRKFKLEKLNENNKKSNFN